MGYVQVIKKNGIALTDATLFDDASGLKCCS